MNASDLKAAFDRLDDSLPPVTVPLDRLRTRNRRSDRLRAGFLIGATVAAVVAMIFASTFSHPPEAGPAPPTAPSASPTVSDPQTLIALHVMQQIQGRLTGKIIAAGSVVAPAKAAESVMFPGEDNLQRLIPSGKLLVVKLAGHFTAVHSCPYGASCNEEYTSMLVFADATTGGQVSTLFSYDSAADLTDPDGAPAGKRDLRAVGTVVTLPVPRR